MKDRGRRKRTGLGVRAIAALVGGAACGPTAQPELPPPTATPQPPRSAALATPSATEPAVETSPPVAGADPTSALRPFVLLHDAPVRRELYTWTTDDQVEALKKNPTLLTRAESPAYGASFFDEVMESRAQAGDGTAKLIHTQAFAKARFAWPHAWPTLLGWRGEAYGDQLIRVVLKGGALVAILRDGGTAWRIVDVDGHDRSEDDLRQHPELLAAVYFVHDAPALSAAPHPRRAERLHYREFVLVNESQIELYEVGTDATVIEIDRGIASTEAMLAWVEQKGKLALDLDAFNSAASQIVWPGRAAPDRVPLDAYAASLAFPNEVYIPSPDNLRSLLSKLRSVRRAGPGLTHRPTVPFPGAKALIPVPKPVPKPRRRIGSFSGTF